MITVYSKVGCPKCRVLKMKLEKKNIQFSGCEDQDKMKEMGFMSLPVMDVDGTIMKFEDAVKYVNTL